MSTIIPAQWISEPELFKGRPKSEYECPKVWAKILMIDGKEVAKVYFSDENCRNFKSLDDGSCGYRGEIEIVQTLHLDGIVKGQS